MIVSLVELAAALQPEVARKAAIIAATFCPSAKFTYNYDGTEISDETSDRLKSYFINPNSVLSLTSK